MEKKGGRKTPQEKKENKNENSNLVSGGGGTLATSDFIEKIAAFAAAVFAWSSGNLFHDDPFVKVWFDCITLSLISVSIIHILSDNRRLFTPFKGRPWMLCTVAIAIWVSMATGRHVDLYYAKALFPGNAAMPPVPGNDANILNAEFVVFWGRTPMTVHEFPCHLITQDGEDMLLLEREGKDIYVSLKAFDKHERGYVRITKNKIETIDNNLCDKPKKLPNRLAIEGTNYRNVFDIEYLNDRAIRITGDFCIRNGVRFNIQMDRQDLGPLLTFNAPGAALREAGIDYYTDENGELKRHVRNYREAPYKPKRT